MKKLVSIALSAVLAVGMSVNAFADDWNDLMDNLPLEQKKSLSAPSLTTFDTYPGSFIWTEVNRELFGATLPGGRVDQTPLTAREISKAKIRMETAYIKGRGAFGNIGIERLDNESRYVAIVHFTDVLASVDDVEFEILTFLRIDGKAYKDLGLAFSGKISNELVRADGDTDYFFFGEGTLVMDLTEPIPPSKNLELDLGAGISLYPKKILSAQRYWAYASNDDISDEDEAIMEKYPSINEIITIQQVNLGVWPKSGSEPRALRGWEARIHDNPNMYAYARGPEDTMIFLGKSDGPLPVVEKYFLSLLPLNEGDA